MAVEATFLPNSAGSIEFSKYSKPALAPGPSYAVSILSPSLAIHDNDNLPLSFSSLKMKPFQLIRVTFFV